MSKNGFLLHMTGISLSILIIMAYLIPQYGTSIPATIITAVSAVWFALFVMANPPRKRKEPSE